MTPQSLRRAGILACTALGLLLPRAAAAQSPDLPRLIDEITADVEANRKLTQVIVDKLFSFAELGFHEV